MYDQSALHRPADVNVLNGHRPALSDVLSQRDQYVRGDIDESDERAPGRGMTLAIILGIASWIGIALLGVLLFLR
jgi:hypothetical protein